MSNYIGNIHSKLFGVDDFGATVIGRKRAWRADRLFIDLRCASVVISSELKVDDSCSRTHPVDSTPTSKSNVIEIE